MLNLAAIEGGAGKVKKAKRDWKLIGWKLLKCLSYELNSIESNVRDDRERLYKMLEVWLTRANTLRLSRRSLKEALEGIGREDLAGKININSTHGE